MKNNATNRDFANAIKKLAGTDKIDYGYRKAIIKKVSISKINEYGWFVEYIDNGKTEWVKNEADECKTPLGRIQNGILFPSEDMEVKILKKYGEDTHVIVGYTTLHDEFAPGTRVISMGDGIVALSGNLIYIKLNGSELKITDKKIEINAEEVFVNGIKI